MLLILSWLIIALGIGHTATGLLLYKKPLTSAFADGYWNSFKADKGRTLAFWFVLFGPMLSFLGYLCTYAVNTGDHGLLQRLAVFLLCVGLSGGLAFPKSPFWVVVVTSTLMLMKIHAVI
jgi:hypothetical protein